MPCYLGDRADATLALLYMFLTCNRHVQHARIMRVKYAGLRLDIAKVLLCVEAQALSHS